MTFISPHKKPQVLNDGAVGYTMSTVCDISVGNWQMRALAVELVAPVTSKLDEVLHPVNVGWVPGTLINKPVERADRRIITARVQGQAIYVLLLDFLKAFPSVDQTSLWLILETMGWDKRIIDLLALLHIDMTQVLQMGNRSLPCLPRTRGLWTGSGASTVLLMILLDILIRHCYNSPYFTPDNPEAGTIDAFAEDFTVAVLKLVQMEFFGSGLKDFSAWSGVHVSRSKSLLVMPTGLSTGPWG
jgi:hypothetical protein